MSQEESVQVKKVKAYALTILTPWTLNSECAQRFALVLSPKEFSQCCLQDSVLLTQFEKCPRETPLLMEHQCHLVATLSTAHNKDGPA